MSSTKFFIFFFNDTPTTEIYTLSLHDALPISGGVFLAVNTPLRLLIADAYIGAQPGAIDRIVGGPDWVQSARYDIIAKAAREFRPTPPGPPAEMLLMIRALLEDRFKLKVHREPRELPAYELVV